MKSNQKLGVVSFVFITSFSKWPPNNSQRGFCSLKGFKYDEVFRRKIYIKRHT